MMGAGKAVAKKFGSEELKDVVDDFDSIIVNAISRFFVAHSLEKIDAAIAQMSGMERSAIGDDLRHLRGIEVTLEYIRKMNEIIGE